MENAWVVIEMVDGVVLQVLDYIDQPKHNALSCAIDLAMEQGYEYGRSDAEDILKNDGRLFYGDWSVHIATAK